VSNILGSIYTKIAILVGVVLYILWDIYAFYHYGNFATESATAFRWAFHAPGVGVLVGILVGHLFFPQSEVVREIAAERKQ
jgi:hypothetical protein